MASSVMVRALLLLVAGACFFSSVTAAQARPVPGSPGEKVDVIVVYRPAIANGLLKTSILEQDEGFSSRHRYSAALDGFAASLPRATITRLEADRDVAFVAEDRPVEASALVPLAGGEPIPPTGVRRIGAATRTSVRESSSVNVAVIDTGIDSSHPDLNVGGGVNCVTPGAAPDDGHGHGTHVAGTIAARNDGSGVTGVAPGTRLYAAKALADDGRGTVSQIVCAIDWVTRTRQDDDPSNDIAVANMSLGGTGPRLGTCSTTTDPEHRAICASVAAGVTYVAAAGNSARSFDYATYPDTPAAYPQVLTVTAMSDADGAPGAAGGTLACRTSERDDRYASYSNFAASTAGQAHTIAGPGSCIRSTWPGGGYATISGTSMASPAVAGVVALCLGEAGASGPCAGLTPAQIVARMRNDALSFANANPTAGFYGDPRSPVPGRFFGYLAAPAGAVAADTTAPTISSVAPAAGATAVPGATTVTASFSEAMNTATAQGAFSLVPSAGGAPVAGQFSWSGNAMTFHPSAALAPSTQYTATVAGGTAAGAKDLAGNPLAVSRVWRFTTAAAAPASSGTIAPAAVAVVAGRWAAGAVSALAARDASVYALTSLSGGLMSSGQTATWEATFNAVPRPLSSLTLTAFAGSSVPCSSTLSIRKATGAWVPVATRTLSAEPSETVAAPTGAASDYVSGATSGQVRVRLACTSSAAFRLNSDQLSLAYER